jgi:lysophospholipase L1-like esterase
MRRLVSILATLGLVGSVAVTALANPAAVAASNRPAEYLALGDSIAFGFSPLAAPTSAANFVGYPDKVAEALRDRLTNAGCPGETSSHFIDLAGSDNNCGLWRAYYPLHTSYGTAQLAFADRFLRSHPKTQVVSIDIGANDLQVLADSCKADVTCIMTGMPGMLATLSNNLDTIYGHIRNADRYHHKLVALTVYSTDYGNQTLTWAISQVNQVVAARTLAWGGIVADGFGAFATASAAYNGDTCAAWLRIVVSTSPRVCDSHPSRAGRNLLAKTILKALRAH